MVQLSIGVALLFISLLCQLQYRLEWRKAVGTVNQITMGELMANKLLYRYFKATGICAVLGVILLVWGATNLIFY
jgi:hypothetical protein